MQVSADERPLVWLTPGEEISRRRSSLSVIILGRPERGLAVFWTSSRYYFIIPRTAVSLRSSLLTILAGVQSGYMAMLLSRLNSIVSNVWKRNVLYCSVKLIIKLQKPRFISLKKKWSCRYYKMYTKSLFINSLKYRRRSWHHQRRSVNQNFVAFSFNQNLRLTVYWHRLQSPFLCCFFKNNRLIKIVSTGKSSSNVD